VRVNRKAVKAIFLKVNRAHQHFASLKAAQDSWNERRPYRAIIEQVDPNGAKHFVRLMLDEPIHPEWGVVLGEAVHDLRSALDQCIYWLSVQRSGRDAPRFVQFPVFTHRRIRNGHPGFATISRKCPRGVPQSGLRMIQEVGPGVRTFIESLQPYPQRKRRTNHSLRVLQDFWNQDKHRLIQAWGFAMLGFEPRPSKLVIPGVRYEVTPDNRRILHDRAIAAVVRCIPPHTQVQMSPFIDGRIALKNPYRHSGIDRNLFSIWDDTANVVAKLVLAIVSGDQDAAIDPDSISDVFLPIGGANDPAEAWPETTGIEPDAHG
jgi:hypothetical protein